MKIVRSFIIAWVSLFVVFGTAVIAKAADKDVSALDAKKTAGQEGLVSAKAVDKDVLNPDQALQRLISGNQHYASAQFTHPNQMSKRRMELCSGQHPFATIIGCSDSRVPPEIIFDQGLGDLFIIRVAGNVVDDLVLGSIEYAADHLHTPLIMVLGHEKCGAVTATVEGGEAHHGHFDAFMKAIKPAVDKVKALSGDKVDNAVRANVKRVVEQLKSSNPILAELVKEGKLKIVGARYDLDTGLVDILH